MPLSDLPLLGLVGHMSDVEHYWFRHIIAGKNGGPILRTAEDHDGDLTGAVFDRAVVEEARSIWRTDVDFAEGIVECAEDVGPTVIMEYHGAGEEIAFLKFGVHGLEGYARRWGHAVLLWAPINGRVGAWPVRARQCQLVAATNITTSGREPFETYFKSLTVTLSSTTVRYGAVLLHRWSPKRA